MTSSKRSGRILIWNRKGEEESEKRMRVAVEVIAEFEFDEMITDLDDIVASIDMVIRDTCPEADNIYVEVARTSDLG